MNYKVYVYVITLIASMFVLNGVHFEKIMKKNKIFEASALYIMISVSMSYLLTNFIVDFIEVSRLV